MTICDWSSKVEWRGGGVWARKERKKNKGKKRGLTTPGFCYVWEVYNTQYGYECVAAVGLCHVAKRKKSGGLEGDSLLVPFPRNRGGRRKFKKWEDKDRWGNTTAQLSNWVRAKAQRDTGMENSSFFLQFTSTSTPLVCNTVEWAMAYPVRKVTLAFPSCLLSSLILCCPGWTPIGWWSLLLLLLLLHPLSSSPLSLSLSLFPSLCSLQSSDSLPLVLV